MIYPNPRWMAGHRNKSSDYTHRFHNSNDVLWFENTHVDGLGSAPVRVEHHHLVRSGKVQPQPTW